MNESINQSMNETITGPINQAIIQSDDELMRIDDSLIKRRRIEFDQSAKQPINQSTCHNYPWSIQALNRCVNQLSTNQLNNQPMNQLTKEPISNHSAIQSSNQTTVQSANQSNNRSAFEQLIPPIFAQICSHLQLDEKCFRLLCLSKTINQFFDQPINQSVTTLSVANQPSNQSANQPTNRSMFCRNSLWLGVRTPNYPMTILPEPVSQQFANLSLGRLMYVPYANRLSLFVDFENEFDQEWHDGLVEAVSQAINQSTNHSISPSIKQSVNQSTTRGLTSLAILEIGDEWDDLKTSAIVDTIPINQSSLTELSLEIRIDQPVNQTTNQSPPFPNLNWSKLKRLQSLKYVHLGFPTCCVFTETDVLALQKLLNFLPDSVEELSFKCGSSDVFMLEVALETMFRDPGLLPLLKRFCFLHFDIVRPIDLADAVASTIMNATNRPRPLTSGLRFVSLDNTKHLQLVDLFCEDVLSDTTCSELRLSTCWPSLTRVDIELPDEPTRFVDATRTSLLEFACQREIADLKLSNEHEQLGLTEINLCCMSRMSCLRSLDLRSAGPGLFANPNLFSLLPIGCWPHLQRLDVETTAESEETLKCLLSASPNLRELLFADGIMNAPINFNPNLKLRCCHVLSMVLYYCPCIVRIYLNACDTIDTIETVRSAFTRYPLRFGSAVNLRALLLDGGEFTRAGLHWLLKQLSVAPHLTYLHAPITADTPFLELYLFHSLPHLRVLEQVRLVLEDSEGTIVNLYDELGDYIQYVPIYEPIPRLETMKGDRMFDSPPLEFDRAHKVTAWSDGHCGFYRAFKQDHNQDCSSYRKQFFDVIYSKLNDDEKAKIKAWDEGDYTKES